MNLFDDIVRTKTTKKSFSEPDYPYLNESALPQLQRIRILLEQWFADFTRMNQTGPLCQRSIILVLPRIASRENLTLRGEDAS